MKKLKIWTIALHSLILLIHKSLISIMFIIEFFSIGRGFSMGNKFSDAFSHILLMATITAILGKLLIVLSLVIKKTIAKNAIGIIGVLLLYLSFRYLAYPSLPHTDFHKWAFWSGLPFLLVSIFLFHEQYTVLKVSFKKKST
ncbi:hypothetical protein B4Q04_08855 [Zobellia sp. OII3]|uniref:hypothetical protein n=1 Tax=Zobellia sp. OII3 TaxID=2034520 RepID=UPI000B5316CC|nr:hypothetical protein [Zobellia sp. OII3]OWW25702.1 hypothetical protein B4Q04_08855 [Zobellia sp. OII3]